MASSRRSCCLLVLAAAVTVMCVYVFQDDWRLYRPGLIVTESGTKHISHVDGTRDGDSHTAIGVRNITQGSYVNGDQTAGRNMTLTRPEQTHHDEVDNTTIISSMHIKYINYFTDGQKQEDLKRRQQLTAPDQTTPVDACTQAERQQLLQAHCMNYSTPMKKRYFEHLFLDRKHKVIACLPPKAGCTTWKTILANNSNASALPHNYNVISLHNTLQRFGIVKLSTVSSVERERLLADSNYTKFLVARHPFERVFSAYDDKLVSLRDKAMLKEHGGRILNLFHPELPATERKKGEGVTFKEFVDYIKLPASNIQSYEHWHPVFDLCQPCHIKYDYIVKTETMNGDNAPIILKHFSPYHRGVGTMGNVMSPGSKDKLRAATMTEQGRKLCAFSSLNKTDIQYLERRFKDDFKYFGYSSTLNEAADSVCGMRSSCTHGTLHRQCC